MSDPLPERLDRTTLEGVQLAAIRDLLSTVFPGNLFYAEKYASIGFDVRAIQDFEQFRQLPFTTKAELVADQGNHPPHGRVHWLPSHQYCRLHQTSGTHGRPLRWLDTAASWNWLLSCWEISFRLLGFRPDDRLFFPFSFGPFLGFWAAFEAGTRLGYLGLPGGGMSSGARVRFLLDNRATIVFCTPTYALRLAEVAREEGLDLASSPVRMLIVAGEPGGSIPATRQRIEAAWGARVIDHSGMTETGPLAVECPDSPLSLYVLETKYLPEIIDPATGRAVSPGTVGELVITNFGRVGSPLIRYRTGDMVKAATTPTPSGCAFLRLEGGILGRNDDMIVMRGNNVYPGTLEAIIRKIVGVEEYRIEVDKRGELADLRILVEPSAGADGAVVAREVARAIREELLFRAEVTAAPPGALPRFEMKARRVFEVR